ncbi:hypothetical protein Tco_1176587 [Tanacetum coccineum]
MRPAGRRREAIPDEATAKTFFPSDHSVLVIVFQRNMTINEYQLLLTFRGCINDEIVYSSLMALPVQNINHSAFRSMFEKEKLFGNNFNDWFARLKLVLRVEKKMHVIKQPLPHAPEPIAEPDIVARWTALYDAHTEIACLMLRSMTPELHRQFELYYPFDMIQELRSMFEKQAGVEKFDLIQSFHACK